VAGAGLEFQAASESMVAQSFPKYQFTNASTLSLSLPALWSATVRLAESLSDHKVVRCRGMRFMHCSLQSFPSFRLPETST